MDERECKRAIFKIKDGECLFICEATEETIEPHEAIYRLKKNRLTILDENGKELKEWFEVLRRYSLCDPRAWIMFSVYYDLRERGRVLRLGPMSNSFTMYKGNRPYALIIVLEETVKFRAEDIFKWIEIANKMDRECILAIVDKHGDVSYYQISNAMF